MQIRIQNGFVPAGSFSLIVDRIDTAAVPEPAGLLTLAGGAIALRRRTRTR